MDEEVRGMRYYTEIGQIYCHVCREPLQGTAGVDFHQVWQEPMMPHELFYCPEDYKEFLKRCEVAGRRVWNESVSNS